MEQHTSLSTLRKHGEKYLPHFKEKVISYAIEHSYVETAKEFRIHHTTVSQWVKEKYTNKIKTKNEKVRAKFACEDLPEEKLREWLEPCIESNELKKDLMIKHAQKLLEEYSNNNKTWFNIWVARISSDEENKKNDRSHLNYPAWFKKTVCDFTRNNSQNEAVYMFGVSRKRISAWMQGISMDGKVRGGKDGRGVTDKNIDQELVNWVKEEFKNEKIPGAIVRKKARELYAAAGHQIACSKGWFIKWCHRHKLESAPRVALNSSLEHSLLQWLLTRFDRQETVTHSKLREKATELRKTMNTNSKQPLSVAWTSRFCKRYSALIHRNEGLHETDYPKFMQEQAQTFRTSLKDMFFLGSMDEIPLTFDPPLEGVKQASEKGLILLPKSASDVCQATLVLSVLEDGRMLPPTLIINEDIDEYARLTEVISGYIYIMSQDDGDMDNTCFLNWLQNIWFRYVEIPNALVVDCLEAHKDINARNSMAELQCHLAVMPGGCSNLLQPLHCGGISNWFVENLQEKWDDYVSILALSDKPLAPPTTELIAWIVDIYKSIQSANLPEMIREGFRSSGLRPEPYF